MADGHPNNRILFSTTHDAVEDADLRVFRVHGRQELSTLYSYVVSIDSLVEGGIAPDIVQEMFRRPCHVGFGGEGLNRVYGIPKRIELTSMMADGRCGYEITIVPRFFRTTQVRKSRVFNELNIPDIITQILTVDYRWRDGTEFEMRLRGTYPEREFVAQFEETDFAFISRWLEHYGIFYCFEQTDDGEKLVFLDSNADTVSAPDLDTLRYSMTTSGVELGGLINSLRRVNNNSPGRVHLRDYDWRGPTAVYGNADIDPDNGYGVQVHYGQHFKDDAAGDAAAQVIAEGWQTRSESDHGESASPELAPGNHYTLLGAPVGDLDIQYLITAVEHRAEQGQGNAGGTFGASIQAIQHATQFRPLRVTPWPRISGVMHAHIDGAGSTGAPIDAIGRYRVQFPFDVNPGETGRASRWIRMAQSSAGNGYGIHFPLYPGTEVLIAHVGGDPDRPVIVGAVPNGATESYVGEARSTRSALRTISGVVIDIENDAL